MTDTHAAEVHAEAHHGPTVVVYLAVFSALSVCTALSFVFYQAFGPGSAQGATLIMLVAVLKAFLVGAVFMHLKYDWFKVYFVICPVSVMAVMMMTVLLPDQVIWWHREAAEYPTLVKAASDHR